MHARMHARTEKLASRSLQSNTLSDHQLEMETQVRSEIYHAHHFMPIGNSG